MSAKSAKDFIIRLLLDADVKAAGDVEKALDKIGQHARSLESVGKTLSLYLTAPLAVLGGLAVKTSADFEQTMARVGAVSNATGEELAALTAQARELGATTRFTASQAAEAQAFLSMAGFKPSQTLAAMPSTLNLASAAMLDMGRAADITSNILTGFGMRVDELGHVNDVLVKAFTSSNTDLNQLGDAMKYVAPVAKGAGQSIEDIAAAIGALGNAGIQGSMAGTTLRKTISSLVAPTTAAAKILKDLGVSTKDSTGAMRPLLDIIGDLADAGAETGQIMEIFGDRAGPGMMALIDQGSASIKRFSAALSESEGTATRVAKQQEATLLGAWRELQSAFEELQISLTNAGLFNVMSDMAKSLTSFLTELNKSSGGMKSFAVAAAVVLAAIGPLVVGVSKLTFGLRAVIGAFTITETAARRSAAALLRVGAASNTARLAAMGLNLALKAIPVVAVVSMIYSLGTALNASAAEHKKAAEGAYEYAEALGLVEKSSDGAKRRIDKLLSAPPTDNLLDFINADIEKTKATISTLEDELEKFNRYKSDYKTIPESSYLNAIQGWQQAVEINSRILRIEEGIEQKKQDLVVAQGVLEKKTKELADVRAAADEAEQKELNTLLVAKNRLVQVEKSLNAERLSGAEKVAAKEEILKDLESEISELRGKVDDGSLGVKERIDATNTLIQKLGEQKQAEDELKQLRKKADEERKEAADAEKQAFAVSLPQKELEILRAQVSGNRDKARQLQDQLAIEKEILSLKESSKLTDEQARAIATEKVELTRREESERLARQQQQEIIEAKIARHRKDGRKDLADALEAQKDATDYAEKYNTSYEQALDHIKEIDRLQNGSSKVDPKNAKAGTSLDRLEREQARISKMLESKNFATLQRGRAAASKFEDKYGITVDDDVTEYKGRDRRTGRLIDPKVGKEAVQRSDEAYEMAREAGTLKSSNSTLADSTPTAKAQPAPRPNMESAADRMLHSGNSPIDRFRAQNAAREAAAQAGSAPGAFPITETSPLAQTAQRPTGPTGPTPPAKSAAKAKSDGEGGSGSIAEKAQAVVDGLKEAGDYISKIADAVEDFKGKTKSSLKRVQG